MVKLRYTIYLTYNMKMHRVKENKEEEYRMRIKLVKKKVNGSI